MAANKVLNFNVGVLGHVDSGKTSLSKALSTVASTASFDKNPQSKERGITLDLGFSSFNVDISEDAPSEIQKFSQVQYTLVDCPGHASLIRTIIGGAQIIDLMMLVIDVTKGMQTQTAECLVIGEITCHKMIVVLNKLDMIAEDKKAATVEKMKKRMWKTLEATAFAGCAIVAVSAKPGGPEAEDAPAVGVEDLINTIKKETYLPSRSEDGHFVFSADHCFSIRGQGTVMTGTVLCGKICVNDSVDIPHLGLSKKVKSMQMFRKPVDKIIQGDRAGICVTQFDPTLLERGLVCSPGALITIEAAIISIQKIPYYKSSVTTKTKYHITFGHETVMGRVFVFSCEANVQNLESGLDSLKLQENAFDFSKEYAYQDELQQDDKQTTDASVKKTQYAIIELEKPIICSPTSVVIGSRLDVDTYTGACRIAFHGRILHALTDTSYKQTVLPNLKVFKTKIKEGVVERAVDKYAIIAKNLFKKEANIDAFTNLKVVLSSGEKGVIEGRFGQSGKVKIRIPEGLSDTTFQRFSQTGKKRGKGKEEEGAAAAGDDASAMTKDSVKVFIHFKRYVYDLNKKMIQS